MAERRQSLLEVRDCLLVGRAAEGFGPALPEVGQRLVPDSAADGMMGQPLGVLGKPLGVEGLVDLSDSDFKATAAMEKVLASGPCLIRCGRAAGARRRFP